MDNVKDTPDQLAKVPFDPGWNDPPPLRDSSQQITSSKPRNFLNKRVAFPLSGSTNAVPPSAVNLPLMPAGMPPIIPPPVQNLPKNPTNEEFSIDSEHTLDEVKQILLDFLEQSSELGSKAAADIRRRIDAMDEMWRNGKLNNTIQMQMKELACALRDDQPSKADDIHRALMISHVGVVGTWMPGVKQLVHHCIARSELLKIDKDT